MNLVLNLVLAFIEATSWAYFACMIFLFLGKPVLVGIDNRLQGIFYLILFAVLQYVSYNPGIWILNKALGIFYAFATVASFTGIQKWATYWKDDPKKGSGVLQVGMAYWDLALAVDFLYLN